MLQPIQLLASTIVPTCLEAVSDSTRPYKLLGGLTSFVVASGLINRAENNFQSARSRYTNQAHCVLTDSRTDDYSW